MPTKNLIFSAVTLGLLTFGLPSGATQTREYLDPETQLPTWETDHQGVTLMVTQIPPDAARAFYINRGFTPEQAEPYATACVFMTVLRNDAASGPVHFTLSDWIVTQGETRQAPLPLTHWMTQWKAMGLPKSAQIAFRWAQFPPEQEYAAGEWNQGMLTTGLAADTAFNLTAHWNVGPESHEATLENVRCAH